MVFLNLQDLQSTFTGKTQKANQDMMDRHATAVEFRSNLRRELRDALAAIRPDQLTLIEMTELLDILRPAADRVRRGRSATPPDAE